MSVQPNTYLGKTYELIRPLQFQELVKKRFSWVRLRTGVFFGE